MGWRVAGALLTFRDQINGLSPNRSKISDGTIGDEAHRSRSSDHNAWIKNGAFWVVSAMDITHDPARGIDCNKIADQLVASRDPRIKYIIWNRRIISSTESPWVWRKYSGTNPHDKHIHVSVVSDAKFYDDGAYWKLSGQPAPFVPLPKDELPILRRGSHGQHVRTLQSKINTSVDGDYGPKTEKAVKAFQTSKGLVADGIVGAYTWDALP